MSRGRAICVIRVRLFFRSTKERSWVKEEGACVSRKGCLFAYTQLSPAFFTGANFKISSGSNGWKAQARKCQKQTGDRCV